MKKKSFLKTILILIVVGVSGALGIQPSDKGKNKVVLLGVCVDGDTVRLIEDGKEKKYRMLLIDTPESTKKVEPYGLEAAEFTCETLKNAKRIEIAYQEGNDKQDDYGRELVWIFVDGELLQTKIAKAGYLKKLYDNHRPFDYKDEIIAADKWARDHKVGRYQ